MLKNKDTQRTAASSAVTLQCIGFMSVAITSDVIVFNYGDRSYIQNPIKK